MSEHTMYLAFWSQFSTSPLNLISNFKSIYLWLNNGLVHRFFKIIMTYKNTSTKQNVTLSDWKYKRPACAVNLDYLSCKYNIWVLHCKCFLSLVPLQSFRTPRVLIYVHSAAYWLISVWLKCFMEHVAIEMMNKSRSIALSMDSI